MRTKLFAGDKHHQPKKKAATGEAAAWTVDITAAQAADELLNAKPELTKAGEKALEASYDEVAKRLGAAVSELNAAIKAARGIDEMRVEVWRDNPGESPGHYSYRIYRLSHATFVYDVRIAPAEKHGAVPNYKPVDKPAEDATVR